MKTKNSTTLKGRPAAKAGPYFSPALSSTGEEKMEAIHWRANHVGRILEGILNSKHTPPAGQF